MDQPLYDGNQNNWILESISLDDYIDQEISVRFKLISDGGLRRDGFYFDDFKIKAISSNLNILENSLINTKIYPVPSENTINISSLKEIKEIKIYDILGKIILTLNGYDINSFSVNSLKPGVYLVKLFSEDSSENHRIIKK